MLRRNDGAQPGVGIGSSSVLATDSPAGPLHPQKLPMAASAAKISRHRSQNTTCWRQVRPPVRGRAVSRAVDQSSNAQQA
jgi:hypothetical protein